MDVFNTPERRADGAFVVTFKKSVEFDVELTWTADSKHPHPELRIQTVINAFREKTLKDLTRNRDLFKTAPTLAALTALAPMWGIMLRGEHMEWSRHDIWDGRPEKGAFVHLIARGIVISRQSIVPIWSFRVTRLLPEASSIIDLDFGSAEEDGMSVHSDELDSEEGVVNLKNPDQRRLVMKSRILELMQTAKLAAKNTKTALDEYYAEYDLSEDDSDFYASEGDSEDD